VNLDLLLVIDNVLLIPVMLAVYGLLRRSRPSIMSVAVTLGLISIATYIVMNPAVAMVRLSDQYTAAHTDAQRANAAAAGDAVLAAWQGTAFHTGYLLGSIAGVLIGLVILQSGVFGKPTGYLGIAGNAVGLGLYVPAVGLYISVFSVLFLEIWYVLVARRLIHLGRRQAHGDARR
jgi:hypothetical protein